MSTTVLGVLAVVVAALITGAVTFLVARRQTAGTITTSTASDLWAASDRLYTDLQGVVGDLRTERGELNRLIVDLRAKVDDDSRERTSLLTEIAALRSQIATLTTQVATLREAIGQAAQ